MVWFEEAARACVSYYIGAPETDESPRKERFLEYLSPADFSRAKRLVDSTPNKGCAAFVYSVLANRIKGQIIVPVQNTHRAIVATNDTAYLFTKPDITNVKALSCFLREYLQSGVSDNGVTLWATSPEQVPVLQTMFSLETRRIAFSFPKVSPLSEPFDDSPHCTVHEGEDSDGYRLETFVKKDGASSEDEGALANATCFGARIIHNGNIVSVCYSDLFAGGEAEIQIRTHPDHRRKGLALQAARHFIEQTLAHDLRPAWSCDEDNIASKNLADQLGFVQDQHLYGYYIHPTFFTWRQDGAEMIGPSPEASTSGFEKEVIVNAVDAILHCLLEASEANTIRGHPIQLLVQPQPDGVEAQLIEENSCRVLQTFPQEWRAALTAQLKFRAGMHIDRQGFPQRGRFAVTYATVERMIRLVVSPSDHGEKMLLSVI